MRAFFVIIRKGQTGFPSVHLDLGRSSIEEVVYVRKKGLMEAFCHLALDEVWRYESNGILILDVHS